MKKIIILSWIWYFLQLIFWIGWMGICSFGFYLLMWDKSKDPEIMKGNAGGAIMALFLFIASLAALLQTMWKYPKKRAEEEIDWTSWPPKEKHVIYWDNLIMNKR